MIHKLKLNGMREEAQAKEELLEGILLQLDPAMQGSQRPRASSSPASRINVVPSYTRLPNPACTHLCVGVWACFFFEGSRAGTVILARVVLRQGW